MGSDTSGSSPSSYFCVSQAINPQVCGLMRVKVISNEVSLASVHLQKYDAEMNAMILKHVNSISVSCVTQPNFLVQ